VTVSYMGTKRHIAGDVRQLASACRGGPLLDLFSGMCAIGLSLAPLRQIWSNDLQVFAYEVATAQFCAKTEKVNVSRIARNATALIRDNLASCEMAFAENLAQERQAFAAGDIEFAETIFVRSVEAAHSLSRTHTCGPPYSLLVSRFGGSYFGFHQAAEADSVRYAVDSLRNAGVIKQDEYRWCLIALCLALSRISTTTGHFAQPLRPKRSNAKKYFSQRCRSICKEWFCILPELKAFGHVKWRNYNKAFRSDAIDLLDDLRSETDRPAVIYADPPYTKDQYSRYYHLLETAILYDFPSCEGTGLYRSDRVTSAFSHSSKVEETIDALIQGSRRLSADLILSYPEDGLLLSSRRIIPRMIQEHYGRQPDIVEVDHLHSTMGASKGKYKQSVKEILYRVMV
jgi:adenine-specific DNA-methyltransferase